MSRHVPKYALLLGLVVSAQAQEGNWYASIGGGVSFVDDVDLSQSGFSGMAEFDTGFLLTGALGRHFRPFRAEVELDYSRSDLDTISAFGISASAGGDVSTTAIMANGYYDFDTGTDWSPYVGGGIGGARVSLNDVSAVGVRLADDDDTVLAYQIKAGVAYRFSDALEGTLGYRFFTTDDLDFTDPSGVPFSLDGPELHNFEIGVRFRF